MYLRALRYCSPEHLDEEFKKIEEIGKINLYEEEDLKQCLKLAKKSYYRVPDTREPYTGKILTLPYHPNIAEIDNCLKLLGIKIAYSYSTTISKLLIKNSPDNVKGCIYYIPCQCGQFYIGQTSDLSRRINEHKYAIAKGNSENSLYLHSTDCNRQNDFSKSQPLIQCNDYIERNIIESTTISLTLDENFNSQPGLYNINPIAISIINKQYKISSRMDQIKKL